MINNLRTTRCLTLNPDGGERVVKRSLFAKYSRCPFDRGHTADRVDRGNALRKCTASTKAALYRVPFRASRISQGKVSSKNKEMFCESNTIGPSNIPGIPLNGAKKHYTVLPFLECVCCSFGIPHLPSSPEQLKVIEPLSRTFQLPATYLFRHSTPPPR